MKNITNSFIGVDVSKNSLDIFIYPENTYFRVENTVVGINKIIEKIKFLAIEQVVCESSGGYEHTLVSELRKAAYKVWIVDPKRIKAFIISEGIKAKTDKIDAKMIALFASQKICTYSQEELSEEQNKLQALINLRADLVVIMSEEKKRLQQVQENTCQKMLRAHIDYLENNIKKIDEKIDIIIDKNNDFKRKIEIIQSIPGVGKITARTMISTMPELGSLDNKKIAALIGVAPITKQSGTFKGVAVISGGRFIPRKALYMAALTASRSNVVLKAFYQRLRKAGKPAKVALVAVMRKLVIYMNVLLKNGETWNPKFC